MNAVSAQSSSEFQPRAFDTRAYLLEKYGLHMTKREVCFHAKKCRAAIDYMRKQGHPRYDAVLAAAEKDKKGKAEDGSPVLFRTVAIADWLDGRDS